MKSFYEKISDAYEKQEKFALCIVVGTKGSAPRRTGAKMIVYADGKIEGTIGGGNLEKKVIEDAVKIIAEKKPKLFRHDLVHQHNMCCGGTMEIYIEPIMKKNKLYIFGAGHTGQSLAKLAVNFDFEIYLIDDRKEYISKVLPLGEPARAGTDGDLGGALNKMNLPFAQALKLLPFDKQTFICIMTYSHPIDREILAYCLKKPFAYLGMIGSQRKVEMTKKMFREGLNISEKDLKRVNMPMGIDLGAEGPDEIALSILSKLILTKNKIIWKKELHS